MLSSSEAICVEVMDTRWPAFSRARPRPHPASVTGRTLCHLDSSGSHSSGRYERLYVARCDESQDAVSSHQKEPRARCRCCYRLRKDCCGETACALALPGYSLTAAHAYGKTP